MSEISGIRLEPDTEYPASGFQNGWIYPSKLLSSPSILFLSIIYAFPFNEEVKTNAVFKIFNPKILYLSNYEAKIIVYLYNCSEAMVTDMYLMISI